MGEIKSTLELVLEKTKHLTLTDQEKEEQKHREIKTKIAGLVEKYRRKTVSKQQLDKELAGLREMYGLPDYTFLCDEIIDNLGLETDNEPLLLLLEKFSHRDVTEFERIVAEYQDAVECATQEKIAEAKQNLRNKHGIRGSAIVPNLDADSAWKTELLRLEDKFRKKLEDEKSRLKGR